MFKIKREFETAQLGGVQSFVNELTRLKITPNRDLPVGLLF